MKLTPPNDFDDVPDREDEEESFTVAHSKLQRLEDEIEQFRVTVRAQAKIKKAGLPKPEQYEKNGEPLNPKLSLKLASISNGELGKLMAEFTASAEYATYAAAIADINRTVALNVLEFVEAKVRLSKTGTVQLKGDKTRVDPRVITARAEFLEKDAVATLTQSLQKNYERGLSTISREITRRQSELDHHS